MIKFKYVAAGVLALLLLATAVGGTLVMAQGPTTTPTTAATTAPTTAPTTGATPAAPSGTTTPAAPGAATAPSAPKTLMDLFWQALAQKLGISVAQLQQAVTDSWKQALTQGVQQGLITQSQADQLSQRLQNAGPGAGLGNLGRGRGQGHANNARTVYNSVISAATDAAAKALGMSTTDLQSALRGGQTLLAVAQSKNVDATTLRTAIANAAKSALDTAAKNSQITQAQADALKNNIVPNNINLNTRSVQVPFNLRGMGMGNGNAPAFPPGRGFGPGNGNRGFPPGRNFGPGNNPGPGFRWQ